MVIAGVAVGLLLADQLILTPLTKSWKQRKERIAELRTRVNDGREILKLENGLRTTWNRMRTNSLPNNESRAEQQVLKGFERWSQDSRVSVLSINPQWKRDRDSDEFMTLECRVEASGSLPAITRFLYEIEKDPMALRVQTLDLGSKDNDGQQIALGLQVSGLVLTKEARQ